MSAKLVSPPPEIDQDKLKQHIEEKLAEQKPADQQRDVLASMREIQSNIEAGKYGVPAAPKSDFNVSLVVGQDRLSLQDAPHWNITFTWHW